MKIQEIRLLSASDMAILNQCFSQIRQLVPSMSELKSTEKRALFKLSKQRIPFVEAAIKKMKSNSSMLPNNITATDAIKALHLYNQLLEAETEIQKLQQKIENTKLQAGHQALSISKLFFHQNKNAAKLGFKDAIETSNELSNLFIVGRNSKIKLKKTTLPKK